MDDLHDRLRLHVRRTVRAYVSFPTVDQIQLEVTRHEQERRGVRVRPIGNSRLREQLRLLSIGSGPLNGLVIAGAHPEPVGFHVVLALAGALSEVPALTDGWTWHLLPVWDPDAARLSQWFTGPLTVRRYYRGFHRPTGHNQPGFTFPTSHFTQTLPETWALMNVIDQVDPDLVVDLHGDELSGRGWFVLNRRSEGLADKLRSVVTKGGFRIADITTDYFDWETDGPGVFIEPPTAPLGWARTPYGASLNQYLPGTTLSITPEVTLWRSTEPRLPTDGPRRGLIEIADDMDVRVSAITACLETVGADLTAGTPFEESAIGHIDWAKKLAARAREWPGEPTVADYVEMYLSLHRVPLRVAGLLLRALAAESAVGNETPSIRTVTKQLDDHFSAWCGACEEDLQPQPLPIEGLVNLQVNAVVTAAAHLRTTSH